MSIGYLANTRFAVGHNRAATSGVKTSLGAHPFQLTTESGDAITMVHNGTLRNRSESYGLPLSYKDLKGPDVDSYC